MRRRNTTAGAVGVLVLAALGAAAQTRIDVVIPTEAPSRPAHFHWQFRSSGGGPARTGQFACGSSWVAPAGGDDGVILVALDGAPEWRSFLTCDADPLTERHGLLNGKNRYGSHDPSENVLPSLPMTFRPAAGSCVSLVAAQQRDEEQTSPGGTRQILGEVVDAYCVVTVMPAPPANGGADMIRPNITGAAKEFLTWADFALDRLPKYDFLQGRSAGQWETVRLRWAHSIEVFGIMAEAPTARRGLQFQKFSEGGRAFRAHLLVPDYASGTARTFNGDVLALFAAGNVLEEMKPALAAMLAYGLDLYHARYENGGTARKGWSSGAGQSLGTFLPPVLAAALLRDEAKAHRLRRAAITNHGSDPGEWGPQELRQVHRGVTGVLLWGDGHPILRGGNVMVEQDWRYWADFTSSRCYDGYQGKDSDPNRGKKTAADPYGYIDGPANRPGSSYMSVALGGFRSLAAAMILMPQIRSVVNTDAPIEYADRVTRHGLWTWPDPVAAPAPADQETARTWWSVEGCREWGKTWGVRPDDVRYAVEDGKGRFRSLHGKPLAGGYETGSALANWDRIIAMYDGAKFEDFAVGLDAVVPPEIVFATGDRPEAHLFCATPGARIRYTLDGTEPTADSAVYDGTPVPVAADAQVRAFAELDGKKPSAVRGRRPPPPLH